MAGQPRFTHIHCSSRFDRSVASLETALDQWMADSTLITLTEVATGNRAQALREKGWGYYNATQQGGRADDAAVCWRKDTWREQQHWIRKLTGRYRSVYQYLSGIWTSTVLLKHTGSGHTLLVSVSHLPSGVEGLGGRHWSQADEFWRARKEAYQSSMKHWSTHVRSLVRSKRPDAVMVVADWNIDLKDQWFRAYLHEHWGPLGLKHAWQDFPTAGGSLGGNRIIDGTLYSGLSTEGAHLLPRSASSDHRPYRESFTLVGGAEHAGPVKSYDPASGQVRKGREWWGFGDYTYDEFFEKVRQTDEGVVVTFDFTDPPY